MRFLKGFCSVFPSSMPLAGNCFVHCTHTAARKSASLQDMDVSGMHAEIDALEPAGSLREIRDLLASEIDKVLTCIEHGAPPEHHPDMIWKRKVLDLLLPQDNMQNIKQRAALEENLNGMVADGHLTHYGRPCRKRAQRVAHALLPHQLQRLQRGRWLASHHRIASLALPFVVYLGHGPKPSKNLWRTKTRRQTNTPRSCRTTSPVLRIWSQLTRTNNHAQSFCSGP